MDKTKIEIVAEFVHLPKFTTRNVYGYEELSDVPSIGLLYIQKFALGAEPPEKLLVHIGGV